jgi:hypothetical protein
MATTRHRRLLVRDGRGAFVRDKGLAHQQKKKRGKKYISKIDLSNLEKDSSTYSFQQSY